MSTFEKIVEDPQESTSIQMPVDSGFKRIKHRFTMKCRNDLLRECAAEFLATFILTLLGNAVVAVITTSSAGPIGVVGGPIGWGLSLMIAIAVTGGVSGCHANPAVTVALASVGKVPWRKVLPYSLAQYVGGFLSSVILYGIYYDQISFFDGGDRQIPPSLKSTAQIFSTFAPAHVSIVTAFFDQVVSTMLLLMAISGITDSNNMAVQKGVYPLTIGLTLAGIIFAFPSNCGAPLNPARDLTPRLFTAIAGWGKAVFSYRNYNYFWVPVLGPYLGAVLGVWMYRIFIEQHWPVDSYDFGAPSEIKTNGEFKKKDDLPFVDKKRTREPEARKSDE